MAGDIAVKKQTKTLLVRPEAVHHLGGEGVKRQGTWKLNPTSASVKYLGNSHTVCYWDYFGQAHREPGEEFPRQKKLSAKVRRQKCCVLEEQKEGWPG